MSYLRYASALLTSSSAYCKSSQLLKLAPIRSTAAYQIKSGKCQVCVSQTWLQAMLKIYMAETWNDNAVLSPSPVIEFSCACVCTPLLVLQFYSGVYGKLPDNCLFQKRRLSLQLLLLLWYSLHGSFVLRIHVGLIPTSVILVLG